MDHHTLHAAASTAGQFQRLALAHLDRPISDRVTKEAQELADLLGALGFQPRLIEVRP